MTNLRIQVALDAMDRASGPFKRILQGSKGLSAQLRKQREDMRGLQATSRDISAFHANRTALRVNSQALEDLRAKSAAAQAALGMQREAHHQLAGTVKASRVALKAHSAHIHKNGQASSEARLEYEQAKNALAELETRYNLSNSAVRRFKKETDAAARGVATHEQKQKELTEQLDRSRRGLQSAGVDTERLGQHQRAMRGRISQANQAIDEQAKALARVEAAQKRAQKLHSGGMSAAAHGAGLMFAGQRMARTAVAPVAHAVTFESAMAGVRKVVDGLETPEAFRAMGHDIEDLSMRLPMLPAEIAAIVEAAGQANIPRDELIRFAEDAAQMGVAFDSTAEESGKTMATWRTAFRMNQDEVVTLADKINYLGNTGPASVEKISGVVNRIGALGEVAGLGSGPLAALGATVAGMGIESEVSATGIKNLLLTLSAGEAATNKQKAAFAALRVDAGDMAKAMQKDAGGAILHVLERLRELPETERVSTLTRLFGRESVGAIAPLLTNLELLKENLGKVADAQRYGGSMAAEYASRVATSENSLQLAKNTAVALSQAIGETLLGDIKTLSERTAGVVKGVVQWVRDHPRLTRAIAVSAIATAALVTVLGALLVTGGMAAMALGQILKVTALLTGGKGLGALLGRAGMLAGGKGLGGLLTKMQLLAGRVMPLLLNGARMLLPALAGTIWPVVAIGAAVAALVWKYWEPIKAFFGGMWVGLSEGMAPVMASLREALAPLAPLWASFADAAGRALRAVVAWLAPVQATREEMAGAASMGRLWGASIANSIRVAAAVASKLVSLVGLPVRAAMKAIAYLLAQFRAIWDVWAGLATGNLPRVRAGFEALWSNLSQLLAGWPGKMLGMGRDMVAGLITGIRSKIGSAAAAVGEVGENVIARFKSLLGIRSPSRVFAQLGDWTMQGLSSGLNAGAGGPLAAVEALTERMRATGQRVAGAALGAAVASAAAVTPALASIDNRAAMSSPRASASSAAPMQVEIHIHAAPGMDLHAIGRAVRDELQRVELDRMARTRASLTDTD